MDKCRQNRIKCSVLRALVLTLSFVLIIPQTGCYSSAKDDTSNLGYTKLGYYMNCVCQVTVYGADRNNNTLYEGNRALRTNEIYKIIDDSLFECEKYDNKLDGENPASIVSMINNNEGQPTAVDSDMAYLLRKGIEYGDLSGGRFNIALGAVMKLWNFEWNKILANSGESTGRIKLPSRGELKKAVAGADYRYVKLEGNSVILENEGAKLDLGGLSRGFAAEKIMHKLLNNGITSAVVDIGGCVIVIGGKAKSIFSMENTDFRVGIKDPTPSRKEYYGYLKCRNKSIVTTSIYESYFKYKGKEYHHILDSTTGYPADTDLISATVIMDADKSVDANALSTICVVMGYDGAKELIDTLEDAEVILVKKNGVIYVSDDKLSFEKIE